MIRTLLFATLAAWTVNLVHGQARPPPTITSKPVQPPSNDADWLDIDALFYSVVPPVDGDDDGTMEYPPTDCYANWCFPAGMFVDMVVNHCNSTLTNIQPNKLPQTAQELEAIVGECICGIGGPTAGKSAPSKDVFLGIAQMWKTCASCLNGSTGVNDPNHASILSPSKFARACACVEPGPVQALINMQDPTWECPKIDQDRLRSARRAGSGLPVRRPTVSTSSAAPGPTTPSAAPSVAPAQASVGRAPANATPAPAQPAANPAPGNAVPVAPAPNPAQAPAPTPAQGVAAPGQTERAAAASFEGFSGAAFSPFGAGRNP
ncbi:uncharacterized protein EV422DRAFT_245260 [Fimicolochytrium jonesii]|uniref:uncharacterized protein n=1 Tax=Fimicolochytrium jonesii TaxID=1396493 RepID=UPI0022FF40AA|nr:uncharacterized protein EV422DRAFT_245260 [Fimicolochytrium jonesii]KAI8825095.1 hypothetical protein EV422DRAFT_245260 [Fimicolochytrium jonesii]